MKNYFDEIKNQLSLLEYASKFLSLKQVGSKYLACCPFHSEKTASFHIDSEKDLFYCFGCQSGGDLFDFYMKMNSCDKKAALKDLAQSVGLNMNNNYAKHDLIQLQEFFSYQNNHLQFLKNRGVNSTFIEKFNLGWIGSFSQIKSFIKEKKLFLEKYGFKEGFWNFFENRVVFPIYDENNKLVSFAGRSLDAVKAKYINGPTSTLFNKSECLYGINFLSKNKPIYIVEGYLDVILMYQIGLNAVSPMGTSFTKLHLEKIWAMTDEFIIAMDSDSAGAKSAHKIVLMFLNKIESGKKVSLIKFPKNDDPASYIVKNNSLKKLYQMPIYEYLFQFKQYMNSPDERASFYKKLFSYANLIKDPILKSEYKKEWNKLWWQRNKSYVFEKINNYGSEYLVCLLFKYIMVYNQVLDEVYEEFFHLPLNIEHKEFLVNFVKKRALDESFLKKVNDIELIEELPKEEVALVWREIASHFRGLFDNNNKKQINEFEKDFSDNQWHEFKKYIEGKDKIDG